MIHKNEHGLFMIDILLLSLHPACERLCGGVDDRFGRHRRARYGIYPLDRLFGDDLVRCVGESRLELPLFMFCYLDRFYPSAFDGDTDI